MPEGHTVCQITSMSGTSSINIRSALPLPFVCTGWSRRPLNNGKLLAALEVMLAPLDPPEDSHDQLEQIGFDNVKSVAAMMLCIPEHGRMCVHGVKGSCFQCEKVPQAASEVAEAVA